jgi:class 3 adenylate cyclase
MRRARSSACVRTGKTCSSPKIAAHHGRIFKLTGDGLLAEFGSVVDAVEAAVLLQREMAERNNGLRSERRIDVRMGLHAVGLAQVQQTEKSREAWKKALNQPEPPVP